MARRGTARAQRLAGTLALSILAVGSVGAAPVPTHGTEGASWSVRTDDGALGTGRPHFTYQVDPGATLEDAMVVTNTGAEPLELQVYAADAFTTTAGSIDIAPGGAPSTEAGNWVVPDRTDLSLRPGQSERVAFTVQVPADAAPGDHSAGIVTTLAPEDGATTLAVERRLGSRIHFRVSGDLTPAVRISDPTFTVGNNWNPFGLGTLSVAYDVINTGNTRIVATDSWELAGPFGIAPLTPPQAELQEVLPGSTLEVRRELTDVALLGWLGGALTVQSEGVGLGAAPLEPLRVEVGLVAVPWAFLVMLLVLAAVAVAIVMLVRRRRHKVEPEGSTVHIAQG